MGHKKSLLFFLEVIIMSSEETLYFLKKAKKEVKKVIKDREHEIGYTKAIEEAKKKRNNDPAIKRAEKEVELLKAKIDDITAKIANLK